ncbi:hypothetical protein [Rhizobium phage RHph_X2_30]|nr:hypothetical protein [Rhizobium phage RHph_X2_30]
MMEFLAVLSAFLLGIFAAAWMTFFPAVGVLYMIGYLQ